MTSRYYYPCHLLALMAALLATACFMPKTVLATPTDNSLREVYVSANGSDSNDGSSDSPLATLSAAVQAAADGGTVYALSDLSLTKAARFWDKDIRIKSSGDNAYTITRADSFETASDPARSRYNPAMIEVGGASGIGSLYLENIILDDARKSALGTEGPGYYIQADSDGDGQTVFGDLTISNAQIVQDAMIATYHSECEITLGSGAVLKNYGGMSAVRISGGTLTMLAGSAILDETYASIRGKGEPISGASAGLYGPAGAIWVQGGTVNMESESEIRDIDGRAIYEDSGAIHLAGNIQRITSNNNMWQGADGLVVHVRNGAACSLEPNCFVSNGFTDNSKVTGSAFCIIQKDSRLEMKSGSVIEDWNGVNVFYVAGSSNPDDTYKGTLNINGKITNVNTNGNHIIQAVESNVTIGANAEITYNKVSYGTVYIQGGNTVHIFGKINGNYSTDRGGAVAITNHGDSDVFMYDGAELNNNYSEQTGGGILVSDGQFIMYGGTISGNCASLEGGGIFVREGGSFKMVGGTISNNYSSKEGGGIAHQPGSGHVEVEGGAVANELL